MVNQFANQKPATWANGPCFRAFAIGLIVFLFALLTVNPASATSGRFMPENETSSKKPREASYEKAAIIQFYGPIDGRLYKYIKTRLLAAEKAGVDLLILDIDSPGGVLNESIEIAQMLQAIDWAHTVAFVQSEAISAAALISLGCDDIVMSKQALFGDIGGIFVGPDGSMRYIPAKFNSYLVEKAAVLARGKGRSVELVEAMIDKEVGVYWKPDQVNRQFKKARHGVDEVPGPPWQLIRESETERFLTVTGERALQLGVADSLAGDREALAEDFQFSLSNAREYEYTTTDSLVYYLNLPFITGLLIVIGLIALYFELTAPGIGAGGLIAGLCAAIFFWSRFMGGTGTWLEVLLFVAGIVFLIFEIFVIPGFGVSGFLGLCLIVSSVVLASQSFVVPNTSGEWNQVITSLLMIVCSGVLVLILGSFFARKLGRLPLFRGFILAPQIDDLVTETKTSVEGKPLPSSHPEISVGDWGRAESLLRPAGIARFNRKSFDVVSDGSFVDVDARIRVVEIQGNRIVVAEVDESEPLADTTYPENDES